MSEGSAGISRPLEHADTLGDPMTDASERTKGGCYCADVNIDPADLEQRIERAKAVLETGVADGICMVCDVINDHEPHCPLGGAIRILSEGE
jgi:hypothetical protein